MKKILILTGFYFPGFKGGGPIRSILNIVDSLGDDFEFYILTSDRDLGDKNSYQDIENIKWYEIGKAKVRYLGPSELMPLKLWRIIREIDYDLIYINGFFSPYFSISPLIGRRVGLIKRGPILLAPRGEFSVGALAIKKYKKLFYIAFAKITRLLKGVHWELTSTLEVGDVNRYFPAPLRMSIVNNLGCAPPEVLQLVDIGSDSTLRVIFLSRISPKKNLDYALKILCNVSVPIVFNIYGPSEDDAYWDQCLKLINLLPDNVKAIYHGSVKPEEVEGIMLSNDLFLFPTHGENYGHVINESLSVGTPVLISDQTPWVNLSSNMLGHDLPLSDIEAFVQIIEEFATLDPVKRIEKRKRIHAHMRNQWMNSNDVEANRVMFNSLMNKVNNTGRNV